MFKTLPELNEYISNYYPDTDITIFTNPSFVDAFIGVSHDDRAIYDYNLMVQSLINQGMTDMEAIEWIDYNTIRALPYIDNSPIIMYSI